MRSDIKTLAEDAHESLICCKKITRSNLDQLGKISPLYVWIGKQERKKEKTIIMHGVRGIGDNNNNNNNTMAMLVMIG